MDTLTPQVGHAGQAGGGVVESVTMPLSPLTLVRVMLEIAEEPALTDTLFGTAVIVKSADVVWMTVAAWIFSGIVVPTLSATRTHMFGGEDTLLAAHPGAAGYDRGVLTADAPTPRLIRDAIPEPVRRRPH